MRAYRPSDVCPETKGAAASFLAAPKPIRLPSPAFVFAGPKAMRVLSSLVVVLSVFLAGGVSHADAEEKRLGVAGIGFLVSASEGGARGNAFAWGGRVVFGYGVSNALELRVAGGAAFAQALEFDGATVDGQQGNLFGDLLTIEASAGVRVNGGVWLTPVFARTRPFLEARGGVLLRRLSGQILLGPGNMLIAEPNASTSMVPLLAGAAGVEHRFGRGFLAALAFDAAFSTDAYHQLGVTLELSWMWY